MFEWQLAFPEQLFTVAGCIPYLGFKTHNLPIRTPEFITFQGQLSAQGSSFSGAGLKSVKHHLIL